MDKLVLRGLLNWWMMSDRPSEDVGESEEAASEWLCGECVKAGFTGLVDAYHYLEP